MSDDVLELFHDIQIISKQTVGKMISSLAIRLYRALGKGCGELHALKSKCEDSRQEPTTQAILCCILTSSQRTKG
jgi:hypothetical protein